ncbi:RecQ family ATP-dependent DNA helicase [Ruegeria arenilitoris]|uniref:RecQ family ATP-dependent DNA helicase n=1 Tax=Ruegeria arenilitoris TaxID=1173585 RepID=UPI0014809ADA|nr:RecQ family ATP-dependent DNA helicase [Ruegeria arenilitoris]
MEDGVHPKAARSEELLNKCVSIDLEIDPKTNRIQSFAGVRQKPVESYVFKRGNLLEALDGLDRFSDAAEFVVGHNFITFDARHLETIKRDLRLQSKPIIDTLWLNPLAFPRNPYHHLVKHYQDGRLQAGHVNDPELDADLVLIVLSNQIEALSEINHADPEITRVYHYLTTTQLDHAGFDAVFEFVRGARRPGPAEAQTAIRRLLRGEACVHKIETVIPEAARDGWPLAYALAWISVAGGDSVMPPWVRHQFPEASRLVRRLRDTPCTDPDCEWCREQNDPKALLKRWFGFEGFRPNPVGPDGKPLQETIVATALGKSPILGILPTGTGKSVCYQLPALSQFTKTGALTVVISPLVALMADQVEGMRRQGITSCVTINGMLSMPERQEALNQVRLGDAAMLLISPEQLRSPSVRSVLNQREVGYWVLDEAHCVSKWGHDFRPDYRYVGRFIKEYSGDEVPAPIICLTATAKPDVIQDITDHFKTKLSVILKLLDGGAVRENLSFEIIPTDKGKKLGDVVTVLQDALPKSGTSGAIVYCSTRSATERVAAFLKERGFAAAHYHAGLKPEEKHDVQMAFADGALRVIAATNAFGMGIDKPDIRLVVHADIPGSLENYLQEAGRAGRDRDHARCILLFSRDDIERQFSLSARSRLVKREIGAILKSLRRLDRRTKQKGEVVATPGEIVREEKDLEFERDTATDDTRVKTAVSWLEEAVLLKREENRTRVFPSCLRIRTLKEAEKIIAEADVTESYRLKLRSLVESLINAPSDQGISTDELCGISGFSPGQMRKALNDLETLGIASNDTAITIFVHLGVEDSSERRLLEANSLEKDLIDKLREFAPDLEIGHASTLNLKVASQELRDMGHSTVRPDIVDRLVRGIARDGRDESEGVGSLQVRKIDREHLSVRMQRSWQVLSVTAQIRRLAARVLLNGLQKTAPEKARGKDIQVETTLGAMMASLNGDFELSSAISDPAKLLDRALLWLHEQGVVTLGKGLTIFRPAMTIHLAPGSQQFTEPDFEPLKLHYQEQVLQTHIMGAYAERGLGSMRDALRLSEDYFTLDRENFVQKWLPGRGSELQRQTTPESWSSIVESLGNSNQSRIVADDREQTNVLVLAGPGSGKTRVLVHRIAYLIRVKRENPRGILALVYNRHAATEIRRRLLELIGDDARGVTISTCHGLAMRMVGASFSKRAEKVESVDFDEIMTEAIDLLKGQGLSRDEAEAQRETLIEGYRWILVDEYQDIGPQEYELIAAVAGRSIEDDDRRLSLFAVGDDDQNVYAFAGASVGFIRRFEEDYKAQPSHLIENYRSTANIIHASNHVIAPAAERMKAGHDITVNRGRKDDRPGGLLERLDSVGRGRVQVLKEAGDPLTQAVLAVEELERLSKIVPEWNWAKAAVIAREWSYLQPVRSYCEARGIPVQTANADLPNFWRLRETQTLVNWLRARDRSGLRVSELSNWMAAQPDGPWWSILREGVEDFVHEIGDRETDRRDILEWLAEWGRGVRKRQSGLLLLSAHRAKGLEFDHVVVLDGAWEKRSNGEDKDAARRLYYVAMTRARRSLALTTMTDRHPILENLNDEAFLIRRCAPGTVEVSDCRKLYKTLDLSEVFLDFAGRLHEGNASLAALERIKSDDPLLLEERGDHWVVTDRDGTAVCRLAKKFAPPAGAKFLHGNAYAISTRFREDSAEQYQSHLKRDTWTVVLPELVFGPSSVAHVSEGANESKKTWGPSIFKGTDQEQASIEPEVAEGSGGRLRADDHFILELTEDQKHILNAIEDNDDGITFSELCAKTGFSAAKVQGDLGAITNKSRKVFGERFVFLNKRNGRYYPHGSILPEPEAASEVSTYHERIEKIKKKSPNAYAAWDEDQEVELRDLFERQISIAEIARIMGRQPGGIRSRLKKIGLIDKKDAKRAVQDASAKILPDDEYNVIEIEENLDAEIRCEDCGEVIPELRLKAVPETSKCVDCAAKQPSEKRRIKEPWGTREEFKKDRQSWIPWRRK